MFSSTTLLLSVLAVAVAAEPCCTPQQWEGKAGMLTGSVKMQSSMVSKTEVEISYDFEGKMLKYSVKNLAFPMSPRNITLINYNTKEMYSFDETLQSCDVTSVNQDMEEACVPPNAREQGQFYFGAGTNNILPAKAFQFMMEKNDRDTTTGVISVTDIDCVPVEEVLYGRVGSVDMMTNIGFVDITPGIKDPSTFDPPVSCNQKAKLESRNLQRIGTYGIPHHD